jgi:RNA polymerase sigma-70 factor (ECF subfamily)
MTDVKYMVEMTKQLSDEQLVAAYQRGESDAFTELVGRYEKELYHFLAKFLGQASLAEEAFQEAFLQVHISVDRFETDRRFRPWLYTIAANKARDMLRSRARRHTVQVTVRDDDDSDADLWAHLLHDETTPDKLLDQKEQKEHVQRIIAAMPDRFREILIMAYFQQLSYKEMAQALQIPLGTVKSRLHAAVKSFAVEFKS